MAMNAASLRPRAFSSGTFSRCARPARTTSAAVRPAPLALRAAASTDHSATCSGSNEAADTARTVCQRVSSSASAGVSSHVQGQEQAVLTQRRGALMMMASPLALSQLAAILLPQPASAERGMSRYVRRKKLDPLET